MAGQCAFGQEQELVGHVKGHFEASFGLAKANPADPVKPRIYSQYLRNLVESMPRRLQEVIAREGGLTKY